MGVVKRYPFAPQFEQLLASTMSCVRGLSDRFAKDIDPDMMNDPTAALALRAVRSIVISNGHGPSSPAVVIQQLRAWMDDGKVTYDAMLQVADMLADVAPGTEDDVAGQLVPVIRQVYKEHAIRTAIQSLSQPTGFEEIIKNFEAVNAIGQKRASTGTLLGKGSFALMQKLRGIDKLPTGIMPLDMTMGGGLPRGHQGVIVGGTGAGKCHAKGQGILMFDGSIKKVEDIIAGDVLAGPDGTPRNVLCTNAGKGEMFDVVPVKGSAWRVNADHILTLVFTDDTTGRVRDVSVQEFLGWSSAKRQSAKLLRAPAIFAPRTVPLPMEPYILGMILGDGSTLSGSCSVTTADPEVADELRSFASCYGLDLVVAGVRGKATAYRLSRYLGSGGAGRGGLAKINPILTALKSLGIFMKHGRDKFVPHLYKSAEPWVRLDVLAGLLDTDGSHDGRGCFDYISASKQLADDVAFLARSVGLAAYTKPCTKSCQTGFVGDYYRVSISGNTHIIPCKIARKQAPPRKQIKDPLRTGFSVVPSGTVEDYYGFSLDGDARYLLDDFTVTHNSFFLSSQAAVASLMGFNVGYITLELNPAIVAGRIQSAILDMPINDVTGERFEAAEIAMEAMLGRIGMVIIEEMVPKKSTHLDIYEWLQRVYQTHGRKIDVLLVDYADKLASPRHRENDSSYTAMETVYEGLRLIADSEGIFEWTASQAQRKQKDKRGQVHVPTEDDIADSINKARVTDVLIGLALAQDNLGYIYNIGKHRTYDCAGKTVGPVPHKRWCGRMFL